MLPIWGNIHYSNIVICFIVIKWNGKCTNRYEHFFGETPKFAHSLHAVGEAGTVKIKTDTTAKLEDHGVHCLFMGYSLSHPNECYQMYDPMTEFQSKRVSNSNPNG